MINITPQLLNTFNNNGIHVIPSDSTNDNNYPCVTYYELDNSDAEIGSTLGYSDIIYRLEVWDKNRVSLMQLCKKVDKIMKNEGFIRTSFSEQKYNELIRKIIHYTKKVKEKYE